MRKLGRTRVAIAAGALALVSVPGVVSSAVAAPSFTVTSTTDAPDANVGDGRCASTAKGGGCTLRAAVQEADTVSGATVVVPAGRYVLSIPPAAAHEVAGSAEAIDGAVGDLVIDSDTTVRGAGAHRTVIDGGGLDRVFAIGSSGDALLRDVTITGGDSSHKGTSKAIALGGGILNTGTVTLDRVSLVGNRADGGGGMFSTPRAVPVVRDSLIADNRAFSGGGLRLDSGGTITNTTITGNRLFPLPDEVAALQQRTFPTAFSLAVDEGTGWGGGIDHRGGADVVILNSTITHNQAIKGGGGLASGQNYAPLSDKIARGEMTLQNTIVAFNTSTAGSPSCHVKDQVIRSLGHNLATDETCFLSAAGDRPSTDPKLAALAANGGPTKTQALRPGSPAISGATDCPDRDQRGVARPKGKACDIGAYERPGQ